MPIVIELPPGTIRSLKDLSVDSLMAFICAVLAVEYLRPFAERIVSTFETSPASVPVPLKRRTGTVVVVVVAVDPVFVEVVAVDPVFVEVVVADPVFVDVVVADPEVVEVVADAGAVRSRHHVVTPLVSMCFSNVTPYRVVYFTTSTPPFCAAGTVKNWYSVALGLFARTSFP